MKIRSVVSGCGMFWLWVVIVTGFSEFARAQEDLPQDAKILAISIQPDRVELTNRFRYAQLLVTAELDNGLLMDVTGLAQYGSPNGVVTISSGGLVRPHLDGGDEIRVDVAGKTVLVPVQVTNIDANYEVSFVRDVMPALSKSGCNAGTCHGNQDGQNGFKLSLRGYDSLFDHNALVDDLSGRRFNRAVPHASLMLQKPSGGVPHGGGVLFDENHPYYQLLQAWIGTGVAFDLDSSPRVQSIEVHPKLRILALPGMVQQMRIVATYTDGTTRDVTADAFVESNNTDIAEVEEGGLIRTLRRGETAVLARYEGSYAASTLGIMGDRTGFVWESVPQFNEIDSLVYSKLERFKVQPSGICTDAEFVRRSYFDLTGLPPSPNVVRAFLDDKRDTRTKREALIDRLIGSREYVLFWTNKWSDLLQVNRKFLSQKGAWGLRSWIEHAIASNMPYNSFVHEILTANGSTFQNPPSSYLRVLRNPDDAVENTTQLFLGIRFSCNKCHDHPFERWTQNQYYELASYFARVGRKPGVDDQEEVIYEQESGEVVHPKTGSAVTPSFPYAHAGAVPIEGTRREQLAAWITSPQNPYFATTFVNRMWSYLMGVGLIEPIDDVRAGNPPTNPELMTALTTYFMESGFDVQKLVRLICTSRVYQHSIETNQWNVDDEINYSHAIARRLSAETLFDAIHEVTGSASRLPGLPEGFHASRLPDSNVKLTSGFLDLFGRPARESSCECERSNGMMLGPVLQLINGPVVADAIADPKNRIAKLVSKHENDGEVVNGLFLSVLNRFPTEVEKQTSIEAILSADSRLEGAQDVVWALLNSPSFLFNH